MRSPQIGFPQLVQDFWVCVKNVGANTFPLVAAFFWLYTLQPGRKLLVSAAGAVHVAPDQHVWGHCHNQTDAI